MPSTPTPSRPSAKTTARGTKARSRGDQTRRGGTQGATQAQRSRQNRKGSTQGATQARRDGQTPSPGEAPRRGIEGHQATTQARSTTVDVAALAARHGISKARWPDGRNMHAAMLEAERQGAGSRLRAWLRHQGIWRAEDLGRALGRARGRLALERGAWPPPPIRGATYGKDDFEGLLASLEHDPVVADLLAVASTWDDRMERLTDGHYRRWYDDGRIAAKARSIVHDDRQNYAYQLHTPALARKARHSLVEKAKTQLRDLRAALDPTLYDPSSSPQEVYPRLCQISTDAARKVLEDVFGVKFKWGREGRDDASALCSGETTLPKLARKAQKAAEAKRAREAAQLERRVAQARALLRVYADAASRGDVDRRRFNLAYWKAHPEISRYQRPDRGLTVRQRGAWSEATVRSPTGFGFHAKVMGSPQEAIAALFESMRKEAGMSTEAKAGSTGSRSSKTKPKVRGRASKRTSAKGHPQSKPTTSKARVRQSSTQASKPRPQTRTPDRSPELTTPEPAKPATTTPAAGAPGSMWSVEQEGFGLVSPRGEGRRTEVPQGHQPMLLDVGKPDRAAMEQMRERELAQRRARRSSGSTSAPLLEARPPQPEPATSPEMERLVTLPTDSPQPVASSQDAEPSSDPAAPTSSATARLEFVDVATGLPTEPTEPGTRSTGRVVAEVDGEVVEIDEEDLLGRGEGDDPRTRRYRYDADSPADYPGQARAKKAARTQAEKTTRARGKKAGSRKTTHKGARKPRTGLRQTFDSAANAAKVFYDHNADFLDHVHDPWDGLRDWMDGIEVRVGRGHRKLARTATGKKILGHKHAAVAIRQALAYLLGKAKGRRWDDVPWDQVDRLGEALQPYYETPSTGPGQRGLYWRPFTGEIRTEDLEAMPPAQRESIRLQESAREIGEQLELLQDAYDRAKDCLPMDLRRVIERRIAEWSRWVDDPAKIPDYACEPDPKTAGNLCNYPAVAGELAQLRRSCEDTYDPDWAAEESKQGAPGFPDTSAGEDGPTVKRAASARACCASGAAPASKGKNACAAKKKSGRRASKPTGKASARGTSDRSSSTSKKAGTAKKAITSKTTTGKATASGKAAAGSKTAASKKATATARSKAAVDKKKAATERKKATTTARRKATAERKRATAERRKHAAAERRAKRLACSAAIAMNQSSAIDVDSYRRRVASAATAVDKAAKHVKEHEKELKATQRDAEVVMRRKDATAMDRQLARRRVRDARCQQRIAQGALRQRKRDHQRAQTELTRALSRVTRREAVATKRQAAADKAKAEARALIPRKKR